VEEYGFRKVVSSWLERHGKTVTRDPAAPGQRNDKAAENAAADEIREDGLSARALDTGDTLFRQPWTFLKSAPAPEFLPEADRGEIAFAGRSNVGKSSVINALVNQHGLARTSNTPGRTQELNYFLTERAPLYLVDMPGYGFAQAPKDKVDNWTRLVKGYLRGRPTLARVFLLIDSRHGLKPVDREIMELLNEAAVSFQVVLTKILRRPMRKL
jgi:GTP-binding protein